MKTKSKCRGNSGYVPTAFERICVSILKLAQYYLHNNVNNTNSNLKPLFHIPRQKKTPNAKCKMQYFGLCV